MASSKKAVINNEIKFQYRYKVKINHQGVELPHKLLEKVSANKLKKVIGKVV